MSDTGIKPCPFCGAPAEVDLSRGFRAFTSGNMESQVAIYCTKCSCDMTMCYSDFPEYDVDQLRAILVGEWNARATPSHATDTADLVQRGRTAIIYDYTGAESELPKLLADALAALRAENERKTRLLEVLSVDLNEHKNELQAAEAERDLAAAQTAAAWRAGRDALTARASDLPISDIAVDEIQYAASKLTPPADASAALDALIAERVREAVEAEREADAKAADAAERVAHWLGRRKLSRQTEYEEIHGYDVSPDGGFYLRASDLEVLVRHAARASKDGR